MKLSTRATLCLGYIVKQTYHHGRSLMGHHRPCDIRELLKKNAIMRAGIEVVEGRRRETYQPTQEGHEHLRKEREGMGNG